MRRALRESVETPFRVVDAGAARFLVSSPDSPLNTAQTHVEGRRAADSVAQLTELVLPRHTHPFGSNIASGGQIMAWMDLCAGIAAKRHCRGPVVTASMDDLHFRDVAKLGELVIVKAKLTRAFRTSMEIAINVWGENSITGEQRLLCSSYSTFIGLNAAGKPTQVPALIAETIEEQQCSAEAKQRRTVRLTRRDEMQKKHHTETPEPFPVEVDPKALSHPTTVSRAEVTHLVLPSNANTLCVTFGGQIIAWMETCATISATRHARQRAVLVSVDDLHFLQPTKVGEAVIIKSQVNRVFHTSLEVGVKVRAENLMSGEIRQCNSAYMMFVVVDDLGQPTPIPLAVPQTLKARRRYHEANDRRNQRLVRRAAFAVSQEVVTHSVPYSAEVMDEATQELLEICGLDWEVLLECADIKVSFQRQFNEITGIKAEMTVPRTTEETFALIGDRNSRPAWDFLYHSGFIVEEISKCCDIRYAVFQAKHCRPRVTRDFVICRAARVFKPIVRSSRRDVSLSPSAEATLSRSPTTLYRIGSRLSSSPGEPPLTGGSNFPPPWSTHHCYAIVYRSVSHVDVPPNNGHIRGSVLPSGWRISPNALDQESCDIVFVTQMDNKGLALVVDDIIGNSQVIWKSCFALKTILSQGQESPSDAR